MTSLNDTLRSGVLLAVLAAQVLGGSAVLCSEGSEVLLELLPGLCCDAGSPAGAAGTDVADDAELCGGCSDVAAVTIMHRDPHEWSWEQQLPAPEDDASGGREGASHRGRVVVPVSRCAPRPPAPLVGSVVLVC